MHALVTQLRVSPPVSYKGHLDLLSTDTVESIQSEWERSPLKIMVVSLFFLIMERTKPAVQ